VSYIDPPRRIPLFFRLLLALVERRMGKELLANRILAWYPKALLGSGIMEALVAHNEPEVPRRLLSLIRIYTSLLVSCPFCIELNARDLSKKGVTEAEIGALRGLADWDAVPTLGEGERAALRYVECISRTPVRFTPEIIRDMNMHFSPRALVVIASTCAQVNFWARLIQSLGVPPAGFADACPFLPASDYATMRPEEP
jgi:AhpD family alkylhydroperoxidase